ncbi:MAG: hypothetical protein AB7I34_26780, partial [Rhizobiaceae bacterium]
APDARGANVFASLHWRRRIRQSFTTHPLSANIVAGCGVGLLGVCVVSWVMLISAAVMLAAISVLCGVVWYAFWELGKALDEDGSRSPVQYLDDEDTTVVLNAPRSANVQIIHHFAWLPGPVRLGHAPKY